jgi:adenylate cyclase, class 2
MTATIESGRRMEVEVKLPAHDLGAIRQRLNAVGARLVAPVHFESNDLYDRGNADLANRGCAMRLRRTDAGATLTFKGPPRFEMGVKTREEHETGVSDPQAAQRILESLGLERRFRYEKRREEWDFEGCTVALDETPIGDFLEFEGEPPAIRRALLCLGLDFAEAIPYTYAELYRRRRHDDPSLPNDMVFQDR